MGRKKNAKRIILSVAIAAIILCGGLVAILYFQAYGPDDLNDAAEKYIKEYEEAEEVIEFVQTQSSVFEEVYAVTVRTELEGKQMIKCVTFERTSVFDSRYLPVSIFTAEPGEIKAYRVMSGGRTFDYIFGVDIPDEKKKFRIPATKYKGKVSDGNILNIEYVAFQGKLEIEYEE